MSMNEFQVSFADMSHGRHLDDTLALLLRLYAPGEELIELAGVEFGNFYQGRAHQLSVGQVTRRTVLGKKCFSILGTEWKRTDYREEDGLQGPKNRHGATQAGSGRLARGFGASLRLSTFHRRGPLILDEATEDSPPA